jgi:hypothetical protein
VTSYWEVIPHTKCQPFHDHILLLLLLPHVLFPAGYLLFSIQWCSIFSQLQQLGIMGMKILGFLNFNNEVLGDWLHVEQHHSTLLRATLSNPNVVDRFEYVESQEIL